MKEYYIRIAFLLFTYFFFLSYTFKNAIYTMVLKERDKKKKFIFGIIGSVISVATIILYLLGGVPM